MNWLIVGISIQASLMSTISYLSVPGEQIKNGLMCHAAFLGMFPAIGVINFLVLPYLLRMRITTIYELFERRFNLAVRMFGATRGISFMWIIPGGCVSGLLVAAILSSIFPRRLQDRALS